MSLYPDLSIGIWNAWIGSLIVYGSQILFAAIKPETRRRLIDMSWYTPKDKITAYISMFFMYGLMIFSIWVPLRTGTVWFYSGLILFLAGEIFVLIALKNYASTPPNEAVIRGTYRISRNPIYFFHALAFLGLCIASASLPMFIFWIVYNIPVHFIIKGEERYCLQTYGESYSDYMSRVSRYFLFF